MIIIQHILFIFSFTLKVNYEIFMEQKYQFAYSTFVLSSSYVFFWSTPAPSYFFCFLLYGLIIIGICVSYCGIQTQAFF